MKIKGIVSGFTDPKVVFLFVCFHFLNEGKKVGRTNSTEKLPKKMQWTLHIHGFCIHGFNQPWIENVFKNVTLLLTYTA